MFASAVERDAPRIAQTVRINLREPLLAVGVWIVPGNAVGRAVIDVEAQDLAEERVEFLTVALGWMPSSARHIADIVKSTAVTDRPIEITIRPEHYASAVVIPIGLVNFEKDAFRSGVRGRKIIATSFEFTETLGVIPLGRRIRPQRRTINRIELMIGLELRVQRQTEQSALFHSFSQLRDFST